MQIRYALLLIVSLLTSGCLPQSEDESFNAKQEGKPGWSRYEEYATFESVALSTVYDAAKAGLSDAGFVLRKADLEKRVVFGEHGMA